MSLWTDLIGIGGIYATGEDLKKTGENAKEDMAVLGNQMQADSTFQGYGVKSGLGNITVDQTGSVSGLLGGGDFGLGAYGNGVGYLGQAASQIGNSLTNQLTPQALQQMSAAQEGLMGQQLGSYAASDQFRNASMQDPAAREQEIYNRMMAAQQPSLDRARSLMEARAFASGRAGVGGSQYGGSGEQFAQSKAEAEARNQAMLGAMGQAQNEMMNQGQLANMYAQQGYAGSQLGANMGNMVNQWGLGNAQLGQQGSSILAQIGAQQGQLGLDAYSRSFLPAEMQLKQGAFGATNSDMAQTGQLTGTNLAAQLGLGGIQADVNANKAASELYGNAFAAILSSDSDNGFLSWLS